MVMSSANKVKKKKCKKEAEKKRTGGWEEELNIRYHDVNSEWNYTISPRSSSGLTKEDKK